MSNVEKLNELKDDVRKFGISTKVAIDIIEKAFTDYVNDPRVILDIMEGLMDSLKNDAQSCQWEAKVLRKDAPPIQEENEKAAFWAFQEFHENVDKMPQTNGGENE